MKTCIQTIFLWFSCWNGIKIRNRTVFATVADFDNFLMIFAVLYEHVYTDHNSMFYKLDYGVIR